MEDRPRVALVLGAGSARGLAHIGVLQVFKEQGIPYDFIVGSSMGAIIGALDCCGTDIYMLEKLVATMNANVMFDVQVPRMGFVAGRRLESFLQLMTKRMEFADLAMPLYVVACDLKQGRTVVLEEGPVWEAVRASSSIPGVFRPVRKGEAILVDGAVTDRLPIHVAREKGADLVIAVDVTFAENKTVRIRNTLDVILQSIELLEQQIFENLIKDQADILIQPRVGDIATSAFNKAEICVARGREAAEQAVPLIREKLGIKA